MKVDEALKIAKEQLLEEPVVKEFFRLRDLINKDEKLTSLQKEISIHQKLMSENMNNDEIYFKEKELYESLSNKYMSNPLIVDFLVVKEETRILLEDIMEILE